MAYNETLAKRIEGLVKNDSQLSSKKMFGGLAFMDRGNMCCGIVGDELMVRVGPDAYEEALSQPHAREMDFTGRSMKGMVYVSVEGIATDEDLTAWIHRGLQFTRSLPAK